MGSGKFKGRKLEPRNYILEKILKKVIGSYTEAKHEFEVKAMRCGSYDESHYRHHSHFSGRMFPQYLVHLFLFT